jgi:hypothetical protein
VLTAALVLLVTFTLLPSTAAAPEARPLALPAVTSAPATVAAVEMPILVVSTPAPTDLPGTAIASGYRITVPRLKIDLPIAEGNIKRDIDLQRTPEGFALHLPGTALPGQVGNTYLYAHARQGMFLALWNVRPGDEVLIAAPDGQVLVYVVLEIRPRVPPTDLSPTQPTTIERLTLQTSTGPAASDPRFVVYAFPHGG